jgi:hypothetical protein
MRKMFGSMREEVTGGWKRLLHDEELNVCTLIKSKRVRWMGVVM